MVGCNILGLEEGHNLDNAVVVALVYAALKETSDVGVDGGGDSTGWGTASGEPLNAVS